MRVLIVKGNTRVAGLMRSALRKHGVLGDVATTAQDAAWMAACAPYDVISLDATVPGLDGFGACRRLREGGVVTPILMLTAPHSVAQRVAGLNAGADDCLAKPFHLAELMARLRALTRRAPRQRAGVLSVGDLRLDLATCEVRRGEEVIRLTKKERDVLEMLMRNAGQALSRYELLDGAWEEADGRRSNVVDVYVRYLRKKIDRPFGLETLETVRGIGYRLKAA